MGMISVKNATIATLAMMAVALAAVIFTSPLEAQSAVRKPSLAVSAPGVLMIYTAKGGDDPGCTSEVEYRTPPGTGAADGTVNVTLANTGNKGDHYRFTSAELTPGSSYDFRVRHTAGTNAACQPGNTWSGWSHAYTFKGKVTPQNIGAVSVTVKTATGNGDTTGSALTNNNVKRGDWFALNFKPVGGRAFPHGIVLEACARAGSQDVYTDGRNACTNAGNIFPDERIHIKRGEREAWHWFQVNGFGNNVTIHLRFRTMSGNHRYWQWENPDQCENNSTFRSESPCKRLTLTTTNNTSNSPPDSTPPDNLEVIVDGVPQVTPTPEPQVTPTPVPTPEPQQQDDTSALEAKIQERIDQTAQKGDNHSNRIWRGALAAVRGEQPTGDARTVDAAFAQRLADNHGAKGRAELSALWQEIADAL